MVWTPTPKIIRLLMNVFNRRHSYTNAQDSSRERIRVGSQEMASTRVLRLFRPVEFGLVAELRDIKLMDLDKGNDVSFGNIRGSDYDFFSRRAVTTQTGSSRS